MFRHVFAGSAALAADFDSLRSQCRVFTILNLFLLSVLLFLHTWFASFWGRPSAALTGLLGACFGQPAIIVDTHLKRVAGRLGLAYEEDPDRIEAELRALVPAGRQTLFSWVIGEHGRRVCAARKPRCPECPVRKLCPYPDKTED